MGMNRETNIPEKAGDVPKWKQNGHVYIAANVICCHWKLMMRDATFNRRLDGATIDSCN
jgi:hypothetical protein